MSGHRAITITGAAAYNLLKFTHESSDVLPPLKSVAGGALYITDLVVKFRTSKKEWREFGAYVQDIIATIIDSLGIVDAQQTEIIEKLEKLQAMLNEIKETIESKQRDGLGARILHFLAHPDMIAELKTKVEGAVDLLKFDLVMKTGIEVGQTLKIVSGTAFDDTLHKLRYVEGASWDPRRVCLANTRRHLIEQVLSWVENADGSRNTNVLLLTGVAGAGKSTIAHTIAQHCDKTKQLASSFFFDRETNDRNNPKHLISTIATDLCRTDDQIAGRIISVIKQDGCIASTPIARQFEKLVLGPCGDSSVQRRCVIVLDALDEGYDDDLLWILDEASRLPRHFCFIVTSRIFHELEVLRQKPHVCSVALDIHAQENIHDMALFIPDCLRQVAELHGLGDSWPDQMLVSSFTSRAEGLFLWVSIVCTHLRNCAYPEAELQKLVSTPQTSSVSAESQMDELYRTILQTCNWKDEGFVEDYQRIMGAVFASKTPLTFGALGRLYKYEPFLSNLVRRQLSPLLTGLVGDKGEDVRPLHQSLRDFLTLRALSQSSMPEDQKFAIDEKTHSQTFALLCTSHMNRELNNDIPGLGYLSNGMSVAPGIPTVSESHVSEELWYACRFWVDHLPDIDLPLSPSMLEQLEEFLGAKLILWMELLTMHGRYEGLLKLQKWVKEQAAGQNSLTPLVFNESQGSALGSLANRLDYMDRLEEALTAAREGVEVYRHLANGCSSGPHADLSRSLYELSKQLDKLGYREEALTASEESVKLWRRLAISQPAEFTAELARSVHGFAIDLAKSGRHEEALEATEEAVKLRRELASERPAAFTSALAHSVHELSVRLASFGRHEEALEAIEEAVKLRRQLVSERPAAFTSDLAYSVHALSIHLASLGRHEEALEATEEAVQLRRRLASERPAAFISDLASSVHSLSIDLASFGRHEEALEAIEEAVKLFRQLASERPAAFTSDLADSVHQLSACLYNLGRHEEALKAIEEALKLRRELANERPAAFTPDLARSLHDLAIHYNHRGWHQKALANIKESAELYHPFAEKYPDRYGTKYSNALRLLEKYSANVETDKEAPAASAEPNAAASAE